MNKLYMVLIVLLMAACAPGNKFTTVQLAHYSHADSLLESRDFFRLRDYVAANQPGFSAYHRLILGAQVHTAFNEPENANEKINTLFSKYGGQLPDSVRLEMLTIKQVNNARLFNYREANDDMAKILSSYAHIMDTAKLKDYKNTAVIWKALRGQPKQEVLIKGHTVMKMFRDKAGLANLEVKYGDNAIGFIFDTGANFSTVTESTAARLGIKYLEGTLEVGAITGAMIDSKLGICPRFTLGNIIVKNAVFLVFPDDALAFEQIGYQINGIIGFPVIEAMGEIQITKGDDFIVPDKPSVYTHQNMALDFLNPVIDINGEHYTFDTGATATSLYGRYYTKYKDAVTAAGYTQKDLEYGGAGGMRSQGGYEITYSPVINGKQLHIDNVQLFPDTGEAEPKKYYGNIGQDVIKLFDKMTINFKSMFIKFD